MNTKNLSLKLDRARWWILGNSPFYGQLAMSLADSFGNPHGQTACTDGKRIHWDPDFLDKLTDAETRYVLLHETKHCADGHLWRFPKGSADHELANQACDHAINLLLNVSKLEIAMPKGGLADNQFADLAEEEIYARLSAQPKQQKQNGKNGQANDPCGDFTAPDDKPGQPAAGQAQADSLKDQWERKVIQAAQAAKAGRGELPADLARRLDKLNAQPIDWRRETADFVRQSVSMRNDWTRSPRRHAWQSVIYPSRKADGIGLIVGVRDTSGSIDDKLCAEFTALLAGACAELNCGLILLDCDARIQAEHRIAPGEEIPLDAKGGGGTDFAEPFKRAAQLREDGEHIAGLVYITDLLGSGEPTESDIPTLWICTTDRIGKTGRTVRV